MRRRLQYLFHRFVAFIFSVRMRFTLWYGAIMASILLIFGGSLYAYQTFLNTNAQDNRLEAQLYQDSGSFEEIYQRTLVRGVSPGIPRLELSENEVVLLFSPDGILLDSRGQLPASSVQQLRDRVQSNQATITISMPQDHPTNWHRGNIDYRFLISPVLNKNARIAILMVGLARGQSPNLLAIWLFHAISGLLVAAVGGYWLAGKALRPVRMITRAANEIHATDLRRRLNLRQRDEFGELAATFDQMLARLEAAFKRQTQFTADASHELRTPLTIINLEINRALTQLQTPEEYRQVLELIQAENEQMTTIVNSLLLLARADTGQITLRQEEVDLSDSALTCVERLLPLARQHQIHMVVGNLPELLVAGDSFYLIRMLTNLLENAIKYTSGIGTRVFVELSCEQERWALLRVQDDGPGIAEEHVPYLFDRFYQADKARTRQRAQEASGSATSDEQPGGAGLGLAIAQWIVHAHGGEIRVDSRMGCGSTFVVRLPLLAQGQEGRQDLKQKQTGVASTTSFV